MPPEVNTSCWSTTFAITTSTESGSTTAPDIDSSKIVWARDLGPFRNTELLRHFQGRHVWLVEPDRTPPRVVPYPGDLIGDSDRLKRRSFMRLRRNCWIAIMEPTFSPR